jgi:hypothetical protein
MTEDSRQERKAEEMADNEVTHVDDIAVGNLDSVLGPLMRALDPSETLSLSIYLSPFQTRRMKIHQLREVEAQIEQLTAARNRLDSDILEHIPDQEDA